MYCISQSILKIDLSSVLDTQVYKLRVELKNGDCWFVFRRYTDFVRLLAQLKRQKVPITHLALPRKKWIGDNFAPSFLEERICGLQTFVNGILSSPLLIGVSCVREFFCLDEPPILSDTAEESRVSHNIDYIYQFQYNFHVLFCLTKYLIFLGNI